MKSYIFHVSLPGTGRTWRKVELTSDQTLEDLHYAIQTAYGWGADHLYSFFMSGEAWDPSTEYTVLEDEEDEDLFDDEYEDEEDEDWDEEDDSLAPEIDEQTAEQLRASLGDQPPPQSLPEMLAMIETNPELRAQVKKMLAEQMGVPGFMADMLLSNASSILSTLPPGMFDELLGGESDDESGDEEEPGDVSTTTLDELGLEVGKTFLYLFDYGDDWRFKVRVHAVNAEADPAATYPRTVEAVGEAPEQYPDWDDDDEDEGEDEEG